jgi:predicted nucleic acid-binding protein
MGRFAARLARRRGMPSKALVVDANILVRAVLGRRVRDVIAANAGNVSFFVPETALAVKRGGDPEFALAFLRSLSEPVEPIGCEVFGQFEAEARERLGKRDPEDRPILASALALGCPIWTEDTDFFGCGVATWTTDRVQMFLRE